ncbi:MAG: RNA polymerase factor sigma-54 [Prevotella sp.]|nr:RNA polymerase factor sigma-54 [Prevotella sp.]
MEQHLSQTQAQKQIQTQRLTQQQMLAVRLLEMPLAELEQSVKAELDDNPALECLDPNSGDVADRLQEEGGTADPDEDFETANEREERESALDEALSRIGGDDDMPVAMQQVISNERNAEYEELTYGDQVSFYDKLKEQMVGVTLTDTQREVMEYVIGSLDSDGLLRKDADTLSDELAIYHNISVDTDEIEKVIAVLQTFDPPGICGRSLQECLLLQIRRKSPSFMRTLMEKVVSNCFDDFMNKRWHRLTAQLGVDADTVKVVCKELLKLNPKPGSSLGETEGRNTQQITPDFIVDTADDGTVTFTVSGGHVPELYVSPSFVDMVTEYIKNKGKMNRHEKEALLYAKEKVERAQGFIDAVKQRRHTLYITMKAIIDIQIAFFRDGDEADLKPMILKDVADKTGLDISTVSRVSNMKYAQTRWGTFKLRHFFSDSIRTENGEEMSTRKIKTALKELIDNEDKSNPLNDDAVKDMMQSKGYPVARRTVAKYREQLGIPVARLRKR